MQYAGFFRIKTITSFITIQLKHVFKTVILVAKYFSICAKIVLLMTTIKVTNEIILQFSSIQDIVVQDHETNYYILFMFI